MAAAIAAADTYGLPRDIPPVEALLEEVHRTAGHVDWLAMVIRSHEPEELAWGRSSREHGRAERGEIDKIVETAAPSVWLTQYRAERAHLVDVCAKAIACGIAERQVRVAEEQGRLVADVFRAALADPELGLTPAQREAAHGVVSRHLRAVADLPPAPR